MKPVSKMYTVREIADKLGIKENTCRFRIRRAGVMPVGHRTVITPQGARQVNLYADAQVTKIIQTRRAGRPRRDASLFVLTAQDVNERLGIDRYPTITDCHKALVVFPHVIKKVRTRDDRVMRVKHYQESVVATLADKRRGRRMFTIAQAAAFLGVSPGRISQMITDGKLVSPANSLITRASLERELRLRAAEPPAASPLQREIAAFNAEARDRAVKTPEPPVKTPPAPASEDPDAPVITDQIWKVGSVYIMLAPGWRPQVYLSGQGTPIIQINKADKTDISRSF